MGEDVTLKCRLFAYIWPIGTTYGVQVPRTSNLSVVGPTWHYHPHFGGSFDVTLALSFVHISL